MAKYNWTIDTLIERLNLIQKLLTIETDPEKLKMLQNDYYALQEHIDEYYDHNPIESMKLLESFKYIKK